MNKMLIEYMNIISMHGELSSAIKSPKLKTKDWIQSPSVAFRAVNMYVPFSGIPCVNSFLSFSVLFVNTSDLAKNFARGSETRLRALLNNSCFCTQTIFIKLNIKETIQWQE